MTIKATNQGDWNVQPAGTTRGKGGSGTTLPAAFVPEGARTEEFVAETQRTRGAAGAPPALDITTDLGPDEGAVLALRHPSGALTFHAPRETVRTRGGGPSDARFIVPIPAPAPEDQAPASRGVVSNFITGTVIKVADLVVGGAVGFVLSNLAASLEAKLWERKGLREGWLKVTKEGLKSGKLEAGTPSSTGRSLLLIHGTFSNAASAYKSLANTTFLDDVEPLYDDRIFAFDHFTISRTPEENVRMLLEALPDRKFTFDVITHSRGGLVLRNLVERSAVHGPLASRFALGHAVLVAAPNEGTPLATPSRWEDTVAWVANLLEIFPENPFSTGAEFVAHGLAWIAKHASGDLPGIRSMDGDGELVRELQSPPGPPADRYSALVANYSPGGSVVRRLLDMGLDQFFGTANDLVVPSEGGWRVDPSGGSFIPGERIGCFGPGGNMPGNDVTHVNLFAQPATVPFLVAALGGQPHKLAPLDPALQLPDRRLLRAGAPGVSAPPVSVAGRPAPAMRARKRGRAPVPAAAAAETRLELSVVNGNLTFEKRALLIGHYRASRLTGAEKYINDLLGGSMSRSLDRGSYPVEPGSHRIFPNRTIPKGEVWRTPRPLAVIVAGLGQEGKLQSRHLVDTVRQAVIAWSERVSEEQEGKPAPLSLATTLMSSGGAGITPGQAAQLIAQGVQEANEVLRRSGENERLPAVRELRFVELFMNRASEAWEALKIMAHAMPGRYRVVEPIIEGRGARGRPLDSSYRGASYDFISAETRQDVHGNTFIAYSLDTKRARTEVTGQKTQARLLRDLIATASSVKNTDEQIGRTLYNLLVPLELESFLADAGETQIEVDEGTAGIPWELLDDGGVTRAPREPWAIRSKLLRKFQTEKFRAQVNDAGTDSAVLIIGEPECPPGYPPLPGAVEEVREVYRLLTSPAGIARESVTKLFAEDSAQSRPDARTVMDTLFERSYRVVHIAGHGEPVSEKGDRGGVVLSNETFLGAAEIEAMRVVPELVFVNCCHLAAGSHRSLLRESQRGVYDRAVFASSVAQALIEIGVRCVVAAGWAVDDAAATAFAGTFYDALLRGRRFIDAIGEARARAFEFEGNTWAAYQCYGDPDWRFRQPASVETTQVRADEFENVGSLGALKLALETLAVESEFEDRAAATQRERLRNLETRWKKMRWNASGEIAERFAKACAATKDFAGAIEWYDRAIAASEGDLSFRILEQVSNLRIRQALARAEEAVKQDQSADDAKQRMRAVVADARAVISGEMEQLGKLSAFQPTAERENMLGSAMKRLAMLEAGADNREQARAAIEKMAGHYARAVDIARERKADNLFYPASNLLAARLALLAGGAETEKPSAEDFAEALQSVEAKNAADDADFWSLVAVPEMRIYEAVANGRLAEELQAIKNALQDVFRRSKSGTQWCSVLDTMRFVFNPYWKGAGDVPEAAKQIIKLLESFV